MASLPLGTGVKSTDMRSIIKWAAIVLAIICMGAAALLGWKILHTEHEYQAGIRVYDQIAEIASGSSKMYIPPRLERTPPDSEKCMAVLRLYDLEKAQHNTDRQSSNRDINRLFGSRG